MFRFTVLVLVGAILYGTMSSFVKLSFAAGLNAAAVSFYQALLSALLLMPFAIFKYRFLPSLKGALSIMLTGPVIGLTNYLYYASLAYIDASLSIVLLMQYTWLILVLETWRTRHLPSRSNMEITLVILVGTFLASGMNLQSVSLTGLIFAIGSALTYAVYIFLNGVVAVNLPWQIKSTLILTGSSLTIFILNAPEILSTTTLSCDFFLWVFFFAAVGCALPTALFAYGIGRIGAALSGLLMTVEMPTAIICAYAVLGEKITALQLLGIVIMLGAIVMLQVIKNRK